MFKWVSILVLFIVVSSAIAQEKATKYGYLDINYYTGNVLKHNKNVAHLIQEHPAGFIASYNFKTFGSKKWHSEYNYPDWGVTFAYQDYKFETLGESYSLAFHYNFYFLNRNLQLRIGEGLSYNTNPFDLETNFKNLAFGSHITGFTHISLQYAKMRVIDRFGFRAGLTFLHHSNGSFKSPNTGTNVFGASIGVLYDFTEEDPAYTEIDAGKDYEEPIHYNFAIRGGLNSSDIYNLGQQPFLILQGYADKRINYQSTLQLGTELFMSGFLKKELEYTTIAFPARNIDPNRDTKRVGIFAGHQFNFDKLGLVSQLGYYVYDPNDYEAAVYARVGIKYYITDRYFVDGTVKTHGFNAEAIEFGFGARL